MKKRRDRLQKRCKQHNTDITGERDFHWVVAAEELLRCERQDQEANYNEDEQEEQTCLISLIVAMWRISSLCRECGIERQRKKEEEEEEEKEKDKTGEERPTRERVACKAFSKISSRRTVHSFKNVRCRSVIDVESVPETVLPQDTHHADDVVVAQADGWNAPRLEPTLLTRMTPPPHLV